MAMKLSLSSGVIPAVEQSPTPHSAPRKQYLSSIDLLFLKKKTRKITIWLVLDRCDYKKYNIWKCIINRRKIILQKWYLVCVYSKANHSRWKKTYFSLFCLDFSSNCLSKGDSLNFSSSSAYFFWLLSATKEHIMILLQNVSGVLFTMLVWDNTVPTIKKLNLR